MNSIEYRHITTEGARLCLLDYGGDGAPVLLLHGLAGRASEWWETARWLSRTHRVYAVDQRGHGASQISRARFSRDAFVQDVISVIEQIDIAPVILIGQSMGGLHAFLVAARRPDLVRALIVAEASPSPNPSAPTAVKRWLESWPVPFPTREDAQEFFGGDTLYARTWASMLEKSADGYRPSFRIEEMVAAIADVASHDHWSEWEQITCPTLVVGAERGAIPAEQVELMIASGSSYAQVPDAGHDVHLEQPERWRDAVEAFLSALADE
jgi:pimeloyl-ACP methyl ester carboxylesterase